MVLTVLSFRKPHVVFSAWLKELERKLGHNVIGPDDLRMLIKWYDEGTSVADAHVRYNML